MSPDRRNDLWELIEYNFGTRDPKEGTHATPDGKNFVFTARTIGGFRYSQLAELKDAPCLFETGHPEPVLLIGQDRGVGSGNASWHAPLSAEPGLCERREVPRIVPCVTVSSIGMDPACFATWISSRSSCFNESGIRGRKALASQRSTGGVVVSGFYRR